ncbi:MAG: carbohydrate-binding domain-containing protein [Clostridia bacterium]|nr:carbohydrate-binding domain-containing protein [Clostridia bacterium]
MKRFLPLFLVFLLLLSGCTSDFEPDESLPQTAQASESTQVSESTQAAPQNPNNEMFTDRDLRNEYDLSKAVKIELNKTSVRADSESVKISGSTVTITEEATYVVSGELENGSLVVNAPQSGKLQIVLNGANIHSETSAALYILQADKVFVTLAQGSENTLSNGGSFTAIDENNIDSALFSKQDLTLNGEGSLTVTSPVGHGIVCKDDLVITDGVYTVNCASHCLDANDSVRVANASLILNSGKDAIHCENSDDTSKGFVYIADGSIKAEAQGDGISSSAYTLIEGGEIDILAGGGSENAQQKQSEFFGGFMSGGRPHDMYEETESTEEDSASMKGIKAAGNLTVSAGSITVNSADDSLHSDACVSISGGELFLTSGDDAIHGEETLTVTDGTIDISESYEGLEALNIDIQGGDIKLKATDDGLNAAGGVDESGYTGGRDGMFGGGPGEMGGKGGMSANSNGSIKISGGTLYINSSGDGLDANGTLEISGGYTTVTGPTQGDTATLDYDKTGVITGGTFIGTGASGGMAQSFSTSEQGVVAVNTGHQSAETEIILKDSQGNTLISHKPELDFAVVILSSPEVVKGEIYSLTVGSESGEFEAY